jgi:hypothetical protein
MIMDLPNHLFGGCRSTHPSGKAAASSIGLLIHVRLY